MIIAVDFDGTCVKHAYPKIGLEIPGASRVLRKLAASHRLILWTVRDGKELAQAVKWFEERKIALCGVNARPGQCTDSPKIDAELFIDDRALGCPMMPDPDDPSSRVVDWECVEALLSLQGLFYAD